MNITIIGMILGILMLGIPLYILNWLRVDKLQQAITAVCKMIGYTIVAGLCLYFVFRWNSVLVNILFVVLIAAIASILTLRYARMRGYLMLVPVFGGMLVAMFIIGLWLLFVVFGIKQPFEARWLIPVCGLLLGFMVETNAKALDTYYTGLKNHAQIYYFLLGNGATHREAVAYFMKRAMERCISPMLKRMAYLLVGIVPVVLWTMLLDGISVWTAVGCQVFILIAAFSASVLSLFITFWIARKYAFDHYEQLLPKDGVDLNQKKAE